MFLLRMLGIYKGKIVHLKSKLFYFYLGAIGEKKGAMFKIPYSLYDSRP